MSKLARKNLPHVSHEVPPGLTALTINRDLVIGVAVLEFLPPQFLSR
jgi:hypothetical protein